MENNWGVHNYEATLIIDRTDPVFDTSLPFVVDLETDERDNFVGCGLTQNGTEIYYYSDWNLICKLFTKSIRLIGHNLKFDAKLLYKYTKDSLLRIDSTSLYADTALMSYCVNTTKESHGLKSLGEELGYKWPTYSEMVGKGKSKQTLDKQDVLKVANYCAMDVLVTFKLYQEFRRKMDVNASRVYTQIELPLMRILFEMELKGVLLDEEKLKSLDLDFRTKLDRLTNNLKVLAGNEINPNSNKQVAEILQKRGISLPTTPKGNPKVDKFTLEQYQDDDFVKILSEYNKLETLWSMFTQSLLAKTTLPNIYTTYNQLVTGNNDLQGINTGRLSSKEPNLQQIPAHNEGLKIRELFIPKAGYKLIDADYSQIEYRLLAHFTKDPALLEGFRNGQDVHDVTGKLLGVDRSIGKTLNFASIYGAQPKKIAQTAKISEEKATEFLKLYWAKLPHVTAWINRVKFEARQKKGIFTLMKRWIPIPKISSANKYERMHWERAAVNYTIQGSAAEIMKLAMIELRKNDYLPLLTVHDELLFEANPSDYYGNGVTEDLMNIKTIMEGVVKLDVPLEISIGTGDNWRESKEN
jgi:DNA polymerase I